MIRPGIVTAFMFVVLVSAVSSAELLVTPSRLVVSAAEGASPDTSDVDGIDYDWWCRVFNIC